jgi:hypothetical protein
MWSDRVNLIYYIQVHQIWENKADDDILFLPIQIMEGAFILNILKFDNFL